MEKFIVTTTIHEPTKATLKFCEKKDWFFIIVGDLKTPHSSYEALQKIHSNVLYLSPEDQEKKYKKLSDSIGWKSIERRNIGFVEAYKRGADVIATIDDDNIPYENWGEELFINKEIEVDLYEPETEVFDPLSITEHNYLWHRGYPIELLEKKNNVRHKGKVKRKVLVQADLWNGDPDIDAVARISFRPDVKFETIKGPYSSDIMSPFNSQNTFLSREVFPCYSVLPFIGRMDDIWSAYILQNEFPSSTIYNKPTVFQERNPHNLAIDLEKELIGYKHSYDLIKDIGSFERFLPKETLEFYKIYKDIF